MVPWPLCNKTGKDRIVSFQLIVNVIHVLLFINLRWQNLEFINVILNLPFTWGLWRGGDIYPLDRADPVVPVWYFIQGLVKRDLGDLTVDWVLLQGFGLVRFEGNSHVFSSVRVEVTNLWGELELWLVGPCKPQTVCLWVVSHGEGQSSGFIDEAVSKSDQVWLGS